MHSNRDKSLDFDQDELRKRSIEEQFEHDAQVWQAYLNDNTVNASPVSNQKKNIVKRIFTTLQYGNLQRQVRSGYEDISAVNKQLMDAQGKSNNQPPLNLAAVLSHGGRVTIKIPPLDKGENTNPNEFIRWLIGSTSQIAQNNKIADEMGAPVFIRTAATHTIRLKKNSQSDVEEKKLSPANPRHIPTFVADFLKKRHLGINIGLGNKDKAAPDNGSYVHLYLYWKPPTEQEQGALMVGCENSAPGRANRYGAVHDMSAKSDEFSPTGGEKFSNKKFDEYRLRANKVGGLEIQLTKEQMKVLIQKKAEDFNIKQLNSRIGAPSIGNEFKAAKLADSTRKINDLISKHRPSTQPANKSSWVRGEMPKESSQQVVNPPEKPQEKAKKDELITELWSEGYKPKLR